MILVLVIQTVRGCGFREWVNAQTNTFLTLRENVELTLYRPI